MATRWAKRNFPKLRQTTLDKAKKLIEGTESQTDSDTAPLPHPPATADPPASPSVTAPPLPADTSHSEPTPCVPHHPPFSISVVRSTKPRRPPPKASTSSVQTPQPPQRQDPRSHDDLFPGDDELPCSPASQPPKRPGVNIHSPLKSRSVGQLVPIDPRDADEADINDDDDEAEDPHDTKDESPTQARFATPISTTKSHIKNGKTTHTT